MPEAVLPIVIADERVRTVVQATVVFPEVVLLFERANTLVLIDRCRVLNNAVVIQGRVVINVPYKTGAVTTITEPTTVCGDLRHCTAFIPFTLLADVPGAADGDQCRIVRAGVADLLIDRAEVGTLGVVGMTEQTGTLGVGVTNGNNVVAGMTGQGNNVVTAMMDQSGNSDQVAGITDRLNVTAEISVHFQVTRDQTVNVQGTIQPTNRFVTFPTFPTFQ